MRDSIIQTGYVTRNFDKALDYWTNVIGAGPFFIADFATEQQVYRGTPTAAHVTVAMGYSGDTQIEIVRQNNEQPSAYTELFTPDRLEPVGGIFHHIMIRHDDYERAYRRYCEAGATQCFDAIVPGVGRFCYLDARSLMDCFIEFLEVSPPFDAACARMRDLHRDWDGREPRRSYEELILELV